MKYNNYTTNDFANALDKLGRAKQVHNHTFAGDFTAENIFWSIIGCIFQTMVYLVVYPIVYVVVNSIKYFKN